MLASCGKSANNASNVTGPKALNAASVGANKVNGPGPERYPSKPHVSIPISRTEWSAEVTTTSYTVLVAYTQLPSSIIAAGS